MWTLWQAALPDHSVSLDGLRFRWGDAANRHVVRAGGRLIGAVEVAPPGTPWAPRSEVGHLRYLLVHPDARGAGVGGALLAWAEARLTALGAREVVAGGEPWHFFPGPPEGRGGFLAQRGYTVGAAAACDLRHALNDLPVAPLVAGGEVGALQDVGALDAFLTEVFPGRWRWDALRVAALAPQQVLVLTRGSVVRGFALVGRADDPVPLPSGLWADALTGGAAGGVAGGLGPMGLHPEERGRGAGRALLHAGMRALAARGVTHMGIDWTGIAPFYEGSGFRVWRRYHSARRALRVEPRA